MPRFINKTVDRRDHANKLLKVAFPDYRRKQVRIVPATSVTLCDLNWDGGSRAEYRKVVYTRDTGALNVTPLGDNHSHPAHNTDQGRTVLLSLGEIVVRAGVFCGKPSMAMVYIRPEDIEGVLGLGVARELMVTTEEA